MYSLLGPGARHAAPRGLQPDQAAEAGGDARRAATVRGQADRGDAGGDQRPPSRPRSRPGCGCQVPGVAGDLHARRGSPSRCRSSCRIPARWSGRSGPGRRTGRSRSAGRWRCGMYPAQSFEPLSCIRPAIAWPRSLMKIGHAVAAIPAVVRVCRWRGWRGRRRTGRATAMSLAVIDAGDALGDLGGDFLRGAVTLAGADEGGERGGVESGPFVPGDGGHGLGSSRCGPEGMVSKPRK
jgi:hypothetical protein